MAVGNGMSHARNSNLQRSDQSPMTHSRKVGCDNNLQDRDEVLTALPNRIATRIPRPSHRRRRLAGPLSAGA